MALMHPGGYIPTPDGKPLMIEVGPEECFLDREFQCVRPGHHDKEAPAQPE